MPQHLCQTLPSWYAILKKNSIPDQPRMKGGSHNLSHLMVSYLNLHLARDRLRRLDVGRSPLKFSFIGV